MGREPSLEPRWCGRNVLGAAGNPVPTDVWAPDTGALVVVECSGLFVTVH
jgi:hypothetical protein